MTRPIASRRSRAPATGGGDHRRRLPVAAAAVLAVVALAGCTPWGAAGDDLPVPDAVPTIDVDVADDDLTIDTPVPAGHVVFHIHNTGTRDHRLDLFPIGADWPPIDEEIANDTSRPVDPQSRVRKLAPGETGRFAIDLTAGQRYGLLDYSTAPSGQPHLQHGVAGEFTPQPTGAAQQATPPTTTNP